MASPLNMEGLLARTRPAMRTAVMIPTMESRRHSAVSCAAQEHGQREEHDRRRPVGRAQGQPGRGVGHEVLEGAADPRGVAVGERPDGEHHAEEEEDEEEGALPPADERGGDEGQDGHGVGRDQQDRSAG